MSRNFELWQRASEPEPVPLPPTLPAPATVVPCDVVRPYSPIQTESGGPRRDDEEWLRAIGALGKHWRASILFALIVALSVTVITLAMKPVYEPQAILEVNPPGSEVVSVRDGSDGGAEGYLETQVQNLQSDGLALGVIHALRLDQNPEFESHEFGGTAKAAGAAPNRSSDLAVQLTPKEDDALTVFNTSRKVTHDPASRVITVSFGAHDPVLAAQATNTLVNLFIAQDFKTRNEAIAQWQRQLDDIKQRMDQANRALDSFQGSHGFTAIGDNQNTFSERVIELSKALMEAQADRIQLQAYMDKLDSVQATSASHPTSLPQISSDPVVQQLTEKLAASKAELAQTLAIYGANHPNAKKLQNEVNELQTQLDAQRSAIFDNLKTSYTASKAREGLLESQMNGAERQMTVLAQYNALKREADANAQIYAVLYQKIKEVEIAAETKSSSIRIIDRARVLSTPTKPKRMRDIAGGVAGGLMGGLLLAFLLEAMDTRIRTPEDMRDCLGAGSVSIMPVIGRGGRFALAPPGGRLLRGKAQEDSKTFLLDRPNSPESEALRGIYAAVRLSWRNSGSAARVLMVASALPGEGKTMLSVNLALALAQHGSTCIVDADLRKRGVAPMLGVFANHGLADVLSGNMELDDALVPHVYLPALSVLSAGTQAGEPGSLIASSAMSDLVGILKQRFQFVVIDSPPILPVADARVLSTLVDGILMIGRSGVTKRENMKRAVEMLREVRSAPVLEYVLNAATSSSSDYGYYKYGYGNDPAGAG